MTLSEIVSCIIYTSMYLLFTKYYVKRRGVKNVGFYLLAIWCISVVGGLIYEFNPIFFHYHKLSLFPYIYLFVVNIIMFKPILYFDNNKVETIRYSGVALRMLTLFLLFITIPCLIENVLHVLQNGLGTLNADMIDERYDDAKSTYAYMSGMSETFTKISKSLNLVFPLLFFHFLSLGKKYWKYLMVVSLCIVNSFVEAFSIGSRVSIVVFFIMFFFTFILYSRFYSRNVIMKLWKYVWIGGIVLIAIFIGITIVRFDALSFADDNSIVQWICEYVGESHGNFCADMWNVEYYSGSDSATRFLKKYLFGIDFIARDFSRGTQFPDPIKVVQFYTAVGAYVGAYGPIWTFFIFLIFSCWTYRKVKSTKIISFSKLLLFLFYAKIPLLGFTYFIYAFDAQQLVSIPLLIFILWQLEKGQKMYLTIKR